MKNQNYTATISVTATPEAAFEKIAKVDGWWAKNFTGKARQNGDTFSVKFGDSFVDFKISEAIPGKKTVWQVTDFAAAKALITKVPIFI